MTDPITALHYTANGNFLNGIYAPGADGFNLADVGSVSELNALPPGVKGLVYLGLTNGADANFQATVSAFIGNPNLYGFYIADEPGPGLAANLKAESDWIHANVPGAKTFMVEQNMSADTSPTFIYSPANTGIDLFGLDPYPSNINVPNNYDLNIIPAAVSAAETAGVPLADIVPVYQAFGGGGYASWIVPTPAQEQQILSTWGASVPSPAFDYAYSWGVQSSDTALSTDPGLQTVFAAHNAGTTPPPPPPAPTVAITSTGGTVSSASQTVAGTVDVADAGSTVTVLDGTTSIGTAVVATNGGWSTGVTLTNQGANVLTATDTNAGGTGTSAPVAYTLNSTSGGGGSNGVPAYKHIVVVVEENHNYDEIAGNSQAPYINSLMATGANLTNYDAISHPSQPNYYALYAGSTFGTADDNPHSEPDPTINTVLKGAGLTFTGYVDQVGGSDFNHDPWVSFPEGTSVQTDITSTFPALFPNGDYSSLPSVSYVIPGINNDMHNGTIAQGDTWLQQNLGAYAQWAKANDSLLAVVWDENDNESVNQVSAILYGANVVPGNYNTPYNHYNLLATIADSFGLTGPNNAATAAPINVFGATPPPPPPAPPFIASPADGSTDTTTATPTISGTGVVGDVVSLSIDGGAPVVVTVQPGGSWSYALTSPLGNGSHTLSATQAASGGPSSTAAPDAFTVNIAPPPPAAPAITNPVNGSTDTTTSEPTISGTGIVGDVVSLSIDGATPVTTTVQSGGDWSYALTSPLSNASHTVTATQAAAGGPSSAAVADTFTVNISAPPPPPPAPTVVSPVSGSVDTTTTKPIISGDGVTGDTVTVSIDGTVAGTAPVANGAWSFTPTVALSNASHSVTATQAAAGGPSSTAATDTFTVNVAPIAPTLSIADSSLSVAGHGGTVDLGISVTAPASATATTVTITGLPKYETITDSLDGKIFRGSSITLSEAEVDSGLTLTSHYRGSQHPVATLTIAASDQIGGVSTTSAPQSIKVTDPTTSADAHQAINALSSFSAMTGGTANELSTSEPTHWSPAIADFASHASGHGLDNFASPSAEFAGLAALLTSETNMGFNQAIGAAEGYDHMLLGPNVAVSAGLNADSHLHG